MIAFRSTNPGRSLSRIRRLPPVLVLAAAAALAGGCAGDEDVASEPAPPATTVASEAGLRAVQLAGGLDRPVAAAAAPGEPGRLYVAGQGGMIQVVEDGQVLPEPFLDLSGLVTTGPKGEPAAEQGLLSLVFAPDYATSGRFYVDYTDRAGNVRVVEYRAQDGVADPASARTLLRVGKQASIHNGGQLAFGPDGALYVGIGDDGASQVSPQSLAPGDLLGKVVRLEEGGPEVVAYGLRNPWRFSFDRESGDLWIGDVGELAWEEVSVIPHGAAEPVNLGWDAYEGFEEVVWDDGGHSEPRGQGELVWPAAVYARAEGCAAVIGGYVYRGETIPALRGRYLYGDFCSGAVWSIDPAEPGRVRHELDLGTTLASFAEDEAGELYLVSRTGAVYRLAD